MSHVLEHFEIPKNIEDRNKNFKAKCIHCGTIISGSRGITSNFITHLKRKHRNAYLELSKHKENGGIQTTMSKPSGSFKYHSYHPKQTDCTDALIQLIERDLLPFSTIESDNFKNFVRRLDPRFQFPSRKDLSSKLIQSETKEDEKLVPNCQRLDSTETEPSVDIKQETPDIDQNHTVPEAGQDMNSLQSQNNPGLLQQHMIRSHGMDARYKGGATSTPVGDMSSSDIGMADDKLDKERIIDVLHDTVLYLCKENYNCAVEVDGLICISVVNSKEQHVVKIHDLLTETGQALSMKNSAQKTKSNQNKTEFEINQSDNHQPHPMLVVKNKSARTNNQTAKKVTTTNKRKSPGVATATPVTQVTTENSSRFPFLVQTLQEGRKFPNNRASSASPTVQLHDPMPPTRSSLLGNMGSDTIVDKDRPASNLLKILSTQKQQKQSTENANIGQSKEIDNIGQSKENDTNEELILSVKQEPIDEEMGDDSSQDNVNNSQEQTQEDAGFMRVKNEPTWNESEYGGTKSASNSSQMDQSDADNSQGMAINSTIESLSNQTQSPSTTPGSSKSILANILKGKEESYTKSRNSLASLASRTSSDLATLNQGSEKCDEQDNSLLYRLPFVTFQDLFPGGPSGENSEVSFKNSPAHSKKSTTKADKNVNLEVIMRKMLEDKTQDKKKRTPRKRKRKATSYEEMDDFLTDDYSEEDFNSPATDKEDDVYIPESKEIEEEVDEEFTMSLRKTRSSKKGKRYVAIKSTTKFSQQIDPMAVQRELAKTGSQNDGELSDPSLFRYACSHCELRFKDRLERDKHEEDDCIRKLIVCDICKGYFANTSSKNKHLWEVHTILSEEQKEEIKENREGALDEFKTIVQPQLEQNFEFDTQVDEEGGTEFDLDASSIETTLVTKFIVPFSKENADSFIKCPLCINLFSDLASKDEHLRKKHKIANQIDNENGTISLQVLESKPSNVPPVFVKFEPS